MLVVEISGWIGARESSEMMPQALLRAQMTRGLKHLVFGAINAQIGMGWACLEQKQAEQTGFGFSLNDNDNQVLLVPKVK